MGPPLTQTKVGQIAPTNVDRSKEGGGEEEKAISINQGSKGGIWSGREKEGKVEFAIKVVVVVSRGYPSVRTVVYHCTFQGSTRATFAKRGVSLCIPES